MIRVDQLKQGSQNSQWNRDALINQPEIKIMIVESLMERHCNIKSSEIIHNYLKSNIEF